MDQLFYTVKKYTASSLNADKSDFKDGEYPPDEAGFFRVYYTNSKDDFDFSHAKFLNGKGSYYAYANNEFVNTGLDDDEAKELLIDALKTTGVTFEQEDLPKQLGGTSTAYLAPKPPGSGSGSGSGGGGGDKKKKDEGMPGWLLGAILIGGIYLLTRKKG
jgi:hypothetical protein